MAVSTNTLVLLAFGILGYSYGYEHEGPSGLKFTTQKPEDYDKHLRKMHAALHKNKNIVGLHDRMAYDDDENCRSKVTPFTPYQIEINEKTYYVPQNFQRRLVQTVTQVECIKETEPNSCFSRVLGGQTQYNTACQPRIANTSLLLLEVENNHSKIVEKVVQIKVACSCMACDNSRHNCEED